MEEKFIHIIDDLYPSRFINNLEDLLTSVNFPWFFQSNTSYDVLDKTNDVFQFTHQFISKQGDHSPFLSEISFLSPFIEKKFNVEVVDTLRAKANLLTCNKGFNTDTYHPLHVDADEINYWSLLYYVNDSDGDTFFKLSENDFKRVSPKKGRAVFFNSNIEHASSSPVKTDTRIVVNSILKIRSIKDITDG